MTTELDVLDANIRNLERENRELKETLRDKFAMAIAPQVLALYQKEPVFDVWEEVWSAADRMLEARK